ncbi:MAG: 3-phosphoshikimate 1-carboxyvinyltransferase [Muribaculaceae bacterium]|nr:3-phosphoshikimate 1-carboxyvinyltransferase [Muribaculaceae bacterium]
MNLRLLPPEDFLQGRLMLPLSKSMSARALVINALTPGAPPLARVAECDDTTSLRRALADPDAGRVDVGAAGTTMRFLTAYYACREGHSVVIDGSERMRRRPIGVLVDALRALGADISYEGEEGYPPLRINGRRLAGGGIEMDASVSSQYVSALMIIAPLMERGLTLTLTGDVASRPYIIMTLKMMKLWGVDGELYRDVITIAPGAYSAPAVPVEIEGDWSAAAAWYEITAISGGMITIDNLTDESCQGDRIVADIYSRLGVDTDFEGEDGGTDLCANPDANARADIDFSECPDLAQCVTVTCAMLGFPFRFTGLSTLAIKETDRIEALRRELLKIGVVITVEAPGVISWDGRRLPVSELPVFDTYDDHRMAMCLAAVALYIPGVIIRDAEVVTKSYPDFWEHMRSVGFTLLDGDAPLPEPVAES